MSESSTPATGENAAEVHCLTAVPGIYVGHWTDLDAATGCTAILCPEGAVAGVDVRGGAPGTRETDLLAPTCVVEQVHGIMLAGGSAFGLAAADGAMRWLEEQGIGFDVGITRVPIVPAAILFDLIIGRSDVRPDAAAGYAACAAASNGSVAEGSVGAGTGATVGKLCGVDQATKGGVGTANHNFANGLIVAALVVVNAWGDVINPLTDQVVAGVRSEDGRSFPGTLNLATLALDPNNPNAWARLRDPAIGGKSGSRSDPGATNAPLTNTTLGVIATNARLSKAGATKVAQMAHDGLARTVRPVHTPLDGDIVFALSVGDVAAEEGLVGALAAEVMAAAIVRAVQEATGLHGIPAAAEVTGI